MFYLGFFPVQTMIDRTALLSWPFFTVGSVPKTEGLILSSEFKWGSEMCGIWNVLDLYLQQIFENLWVRKQALDDADFLYIMDRVGIFAGIMQKGDI